MEILSSEQVIALAPDAASVKAGQSLANPGKWVTLGRSGRSVWGECQGSGKLPYRTQADLQGPAFHCTCPSRKFPCKHGLGLLLLLASNPARVTGETAPAWVEEWITKRDTNQEKKAAKARGDEEPVDAETAARREAERAKRAAKREDRVRTGLADLQVWLNDLLRQGLAHAKQQPAHFFDQVAARMVDAQAPGIARRIREWPGLLASGDSWAGRMLESAGHLQTLLLGFQRLEALPEPMQATIRSHIGWTTTEQELANLPAVRDRWQIVGQVQEEEESLRVQRTWLIGVSSGQPALSLSFAAAGQALDITLVPGTEFEGELVFHPSAAPLRATVRSRQSEARPIAQPAAMTDFAAALEKTARHLAGDPWTERFPWVVADCQPLHTEDGWFLRDAQGSLVPIAKRFADGWPLLALSGGHRITISCEWNGNSATPLAAWTDGRWIALGRTTS